MQTSLQGIAKKAITILSFTEASISEEPSAVVPHAGICAGGSQVTGCSTVTTYCLIHSIPGDLPLLSIEEVKNLARGAGSGRGQR